MHQDKKSRRGCATCKQKKIKCDETKPSCLRCLRLRRSCPGYGQNLKWSDKHEVLHRTKAKADVQHLSVDKAPQTNDKDTVANQFQAGELTLPPESLEPGEAESAVPEFSFRDFSLPLDDMAWPFGNPNIFSGPLSPLLSGIKASGNSPNDCSDLLYDTNCLDPNQLNLVNETGERQSSQVLCGEHALVTLPSTPVPPTLIDHDSILVDYYFRFVASLYSCFDGNLNPFRTTIGRLWSSSLITKLTLQSMAAACLSRDRPQLAREGVALRSHAIEQINNELQTGRLSDVSLLCLVMLGQSAGWHHVADLGLRQYYDAKRFLTESIVNRKGLVVSNNNSSFFHQAMSYWRMILSFVSTLDEPEDQEDSHGEETDLMSQTLPHPWALIVPEMMDTISNVGRLVYDHRRKFRNQKFWKETHLAELRRMIAKGKRMECMLLNHRILTEAEIVDPGDNCTPRSHLLKVAEAYRIVSLIQLYRVFPDVLLDRVQSRVHIPIFENVPLPRYADQSQIAEADAQQWLQQLVLYAINVLAAIPFESHTRSIQAFLYVALAGELRKPRTGRINHETLHVMQARNLVRSRLEAYRFVFAPKPAQHKLDLVLKIWDQMDNSDMPVFWIDVMIDNGLEVVFC